MKRRNFLFKRIVDYSNIRLAFLKTIKGNRSSLAAIDFCRNIDENLAMVRKKLCLLDCGWGNYRSFQITDPKPRIISTAPFVQRIMHHAIMNVLEPIFERPMVYHSYACRKGKGTHAAILYAFKQCKRTPCFLKLDIRKYFDSIDHNILKYQLQRLVKDTRVLYLLNEIIDSYGTEPGKGVPIGNLTSQFFANLYLAGLDHYILEQLKPSAYCRYMDDFVVWAPSMAELKAMLAQISLYVGSDLHLSLKQPVFGKSIHGLPFLGFLIKEKGIYLLQKSKRRVTKRITEITASLYCCSISEEKAAERVRSAFAAIGLARANRLRKLLCKKGERLLAPTA